MAIRWLSCGQGNVHIIGPCPNCYETQGGLIMGTTTRTHKGRISVRCLDCSKTVDYYVDALEELIWKLEPAEAKGPLKTDR